jgi:hypothetical protein
MMKRLAWWSIALVLTLLWGLFWYWLRNRW